MTFESENNPSSRYDTGFQTIKSSVYSSSPQVKPVLYPTPQPTNKMSRRIESGDQTENLMSEYMEASPPLPSFDYNQDIILAKEEPISDLKLLFRQPNQDELRSSSFRPVELPAPVHEHGAGTIENGAGTGE